MLSADSGCAALLLQVSSSVGGTAAPVAECSSVDGDPYEPGQAVGVGIKAEMWKTKHPNLTVLETGEDTPVLVRCFFCGSRLCLIFSSP